MFRGQRVVSAFLKGDVVLGRFALVIEVVVKGARRWIVGPTLRGSAVSAAAGLTLDLPGVEVDVIATFVFVSADIKGDLELVAEAVVVQLVNFIADDFEFYHLRVVAIGDFDDEFTFGESACECLRIFEDFKDAGEFK